VFLHKLVSAGHCSWSCHFASRLYWSVLPCLWPPSHVVPRVYTAPTLFTFIFLFFPLPVAPFWPHTMITIFTSARYINAWILVSFGYASALCFPASRCCVLPSRLHPSSVLLQNHFHQPGFLSLPFYYPLSSIHSVPTCLCTFVLHLCAY
jgi:hypothetical protein